MTVPENAPSRLDCVYCIRDGGTCAICNAKVAWTTLVESIMKELRIESILNWLLLIFLRVSAFFRRP